MPISGLNLASSDMISGAALIVAIIAAVVAWLAPHAVEKKRQKAVLRELKLDNLRRVMGLRSQPPTREWTSALNEICVVFHDAPDVMQCLRNFDDHIQRNQGHSNTLLAEMLSAMMDDLDIDRKKLDGEFLLRPFRPA